MSNGYSAPACGHSIATCLPNRCFAASEHPERDLDREDYDLQGTLTVAVEQHYPTSNGPQVKELRFRRETGPKSARTNVEIMTIDELRDTLNALKRFFGEV